MRQQSNYLVPGSLQGMGALICISILRMRQTDGKLPLYAPHVFGSLGLNEPNKAFQSRWFTFKHFFKAMATKYKQLISDYCVTRGITVPPGFGRNTPSHLVVIRTDLSPHKLVATTWFKTSDLLDYIENQLMSELGERTAASIQILDFKAGEVLAYKGTKRLEQVSTFQTQ